MYFFIAAADLARGPAAVDEQGGFCCTYPAIQRRPWNLRAEFLPGGAQVLGANCRRYRMTSFSVE
jgi:hypothetical protein